ncbi:MAG: NAD(P)H-hydrate dehydratase, partial [Monoglobaceae bacterium]
YASVKLTEVMTKPLKCENGVISKDAIPQIIDGLKNSDVCAIGPGLGRSKDLELVVKEMLKCDVPCVIDADGLNVISNDVDMLKEKNCRAILTPHPGEMSRLTSLSITEIEENREDIALEFAEKYDVTLLLKGHNTVIVSPDGRVKINTTGNSGMASGGMGDVLTGVIASFVGQGLSCFDAAVLGAYLHGKAGDIAANEVGEFGLIASDVVDKLPYAIKLLQGNIT